MIARMRMVVLGVKGTHHVQDLARLLNRLPDIAKSISKALEPASVLRDFHVALDEVAELGL